MAIRSFLREQEAFQDERGHREKGRRLLPRYATTPEAQQRAREVVAKTLEIAAALREKAAERLGTKCFPGC